MVEELAVEVAAAEGVVARRLLRGWRKRRLWSWRWPVAVDLMIAQDSDSPG